MAGFRPNSRMYLFYLSRINFLQTKNLLVAVVFQKAEFLQVPAVEVTQTSAFTFLYTTFNRTIPSEKPQKDLSIECDSASSTKNIKIWLLKDFFIKKSESHPSDLYR